MGTKDHRRSIPEGVRLQAVLLMLGVPPDLVLGTVGERLAAALKRLGVPEGAKVQWDHDPALGLREVVEGQMVPHPNDPRFITPSAEEDHARKTNGAGGTTAGSDKARIAKVKRAEERRLAELLAPSRKAKPKRPKGRPMAGGRASKLKRKMNGRTERR